VTVLLAAAAVFVVIFTGSGVRFFVGRIAGRAEDTEYIGRVIISPRSRFEEQKKYRPVRFPLRS